MNKDKVKEIYFELEQKCAEITGELSFILTKDKLMDEIYFGVIPDIISKNIDSSKEETIRALILFMSSKNPEFEHKSIFK